MRTGSKSLLIIAVFMLAITSFAFGQSWDNAKGFGVTGSLNKFVGGAMDRAAVGNWSGLTIRYGVSPYILFDLNAQYGSFKPSVMGSRYDKDENSPFRTFLFPINLQMKVSALKDGRYRPYASVGAGALLWDLRDVEGTGVSFIEDQQFRWGRAIYDGVQKEIVLKGGLGLETFLTSSFALDLEAGFGFFVNSDPKDNVGVGDENDMYLEGRASLVYYWGYFKDTDGDGIEDKYDANAFEAEDFDGFEDTDGAPDYDNDNDGIPDLQDKAPLEPEDKDGFQDEDGVPDPDNDGDGITDINDKCPNEAEDMDGFEDEDGCPDLDNDGDGIPDDKDQCPNEAEIINDYKDDDGCPDKKPLPELAQKGSKLVLKGVNFNTGSASLTEESYKILDEVAAGLVDNKEVDIEIRGYTDSVGSATANQKLSERRAKTVMQYLVNAGVEASRMSAKGYGEKDPVATNKTPEGRAENRRIEFYRVN
ncbi:OmpA family protein [candidate division KSB1 bacterium]|nr:OmpA family protein [candidate division KSB1 bacterium]